MRAFGANHALQHAAQPHPRARKLLRIDRLAVDARFVVQVRTGGAAGRAGLADDLSDAHRLPDLDRQFADGSCLVRGQRKYLTGLNPEQLVRR